MRAHPTADGAVNKHVRSVSVKDIKAILADVQLEDDAKESIIKAVNENYRSIEEVTKKANRITELEEQNKALTEQVGNLEGDGEELEKLRKQVQDFTEAENKRKAEEEEAGKRQQFRTVFDAAVGEKEFANDVVREAIFNKAYAQCIETTGLDAKKVIDDLTKDTDGIWKNPQQEAKKMPNPSDISNKKASSEEVKKSFAAQLFGSNKGA